VIGPEPEAQAQIELGRRIGLLVGFALVGAWLRRAEDPAGPQVT
jgi:hypothetical protein